jgi:uncharacterized protein
MKLHFAAAGTRNLFTAYGEGYVVVNQTRHETSLIVLPNASPQPWGAYRVAELSMIDFAPVLAHTPEIILLGSGAALQFPSRELRAALANRNIGMEIMDTPAACRTWNILAGEGRKVAAALLMT